MTFTTYLHCTCTCLDGAEGFKSHPRLTSQSYWLNQLESKAASDSTLKLAGYQILVLYCSHICMYCEADAFDMAEYYLLTSLMHS